MKNVFLALSCLQSSIHTGILFSKLTSLNDFILKNLMLQLHQALRKCMRSRLSLLLKYLPLRRKRGGSCRETGVWCSWTLTNRLCWATGCPSLCGCTGRSSRLLLFCWTALSSWMFRNSTCPRERGASFSRISACTCSRKFGIAQRWRKGRWLFICSSKFY